MLLGTRAETAAWASVNFVLMLAGIYYSVAVLPKAVAAVSAAIPLTYFLDAYRAHYGFPAEFANPILTGFALAALYAALAHLGLPGGDLTRPPDGPVPQDVRVAGDRAGDRAPETGTGAENGPAEPGRVARAGGVGGHVGAPHVYRFRNFFTLAAMPAGVEAVLGVEALRIAGLAEARDAEPPIGVGSTSASTSRPRRRARR